ncbi:hypothetical protein FT663_03250 [Candidozyma haemuli var. vulneris]|uniref:Uncharacterized protein n=1 Tax=Candidozyma haemuli TaxID=45357 RepID=A0A2V1AYP1_9ASCO|nr:hypothetical protein CXQ85_002713 [[Candida] haemuloni]KAF3987669.1 hypothetical protein FT662_03861 [[Candida] haemuloni var. vulneris]KAF3990307.1 hypothetical protein FT663_03250 [[Candida] haemuloni var. vulneris]PVH22988.1 hypothetical protein CXQ85_002713 [[Candida] haemuloni]
MGFKDRIKRTSRLFINDPNGNAANGSASKSDNPEIAGAAEEAEDTAVNAVEESDPSGIQAKAQEEANKKIEKATQEAEAKTEAKSGVSAEAKDTAEEAAPVQADAAGQTTEQIEPEAKETVSTSAGVPTTTKEKAAQAEKLAAEGEKAKKDVKDSGYKNEKKDFLKRLFTRSKKNKHDKPAAAPVASDTPTPAEADTAVVAVEPTKEVPLSTDAAKAATTVPVTDVVVDTANNDATAAATAASEVKEAKLPEVEKVSDEVQAAAKAIGDSVDQKVAATKEAIEAK